MILFKFLVFNARQKWYIVKTIKKIFIFGNSRLKNHIGSKTIILFQDFSLDIFVWWCDGGEMWEEAEVRLFMGADEKD